MKREHRKESIKSKLKNQVTSCSRTGLIEALNPTKLSGVPFSSFGMYSFTDFYWSRNVFSCFEDSQRDESNERIGNHGEKCHHCHVFCPRNDD